MHPPAVHQEVLGLVEEGVNDCDIARRLGLPRTTVRDIRRSPYVPRPRELCPRCWRPAKTTRFTPGEYAELLGLYLGDGCISQGARTQRLRLSLDARHRQIVADATSLLTRCFGDNAVGMTSADAGATKIVYVYSQHLGCLFPQHGAGKKHDRRIALEPWQQHLVELAPWSFLRGLIHSDGCFFINRTGRYRYLSAEFYNFSADILDLFTATCDSVGARYRRYERRVRIHDRATVRDFAAFVGGKR